MHGEQALGDAWSPFEACRERQDELVRMQPSTYRARSGDPTRSLACDCRRLGRERRRSAIGRARGGAEPRGHLWPPMVLRAGPRHCGLGPGRGNGSETIRADRMPRQSQWKHGGSRLRPRNWPRTDDRTRPKNGGAIDLDVGRQLATGASAHSDSGADQPCYRAVLRRRQDVPAPIPESRLPGHAHGYGPVVRGRWTQLAIEVDRAYRPRVTARRCH